MRRLLLLMMLLAAPAQAGTCTMPCTLTITVSAHVIDPTEWGMTMDEWNEGSIPMSPAWKTRQCCMVVTYNATHERQVDQPYCSDDQIQGWINNGACSKI